MSKIQSLLQVLVKQKGEIAILQPEKNVQFFHADRTPIKIFLPELDQKTLWQMIEEIHPQKEQIDQQNPKSFQFTYQSNVGNFQVDVKPLPNLVIRLKKVSVKNTSVPVVHAEQVANRSSTAIQTTTQSPRSPTQGAINSQGAMTQAAMTQATTTQVAVNPQSVIHTQGAITPQVAIAPQATVTPQGMDQLYPPHSPHLASLAFSTHTYPSAAIHPSAIASAPLMSSPLSNDHLAASPFTIQPKHRIVPQTIQHQGLIDLVTYAIQLGASDLHLSSHEIPMLRIDGRLTPIQQKLDFLLQPALESLVTADEKELVHRGHSIDRGVYINQHIRVRINVFLHKEGWACAIRILHSKIPSLQELKLPSILHSIANISHGLILVCGPTGSGKSTTLAALLQYILNQRGGLLVTLEDPIEYVFQGSDRVVIRQRELGVHVKSFADGLKSALREDPDFILIGELRDHASIKLAITAAETGHLVLASLHSRSAIAAIDRMIDSVDHEIQQQVRHQLSDALQAVISQRLIPRKNNPGRMVAVECMRNTTSIANMIRESKGAQMVSAIQAGGEDGMVLLESSLAQLVKRGMIDVEDAHVNARYHAILNRYLEK